MHNYITFKSLFMRHRSVTDRKLDPPTCHILKTQNIHIDGSVKLFTSTLIYKSARHSFSLLGKCAAPYVDCD